MLRRIILANLVTLAILPSGCELFADFKDTKADDTSAAASGNGNRGGATSSNGVAGSHTGGTTTNAGTANTGNTATNGAVAGTLGGATATRSGGAAGTDTVAPSPGGTAGTGAVTTPTVGGDSLGGAPSNSSGTTPGGANTGGVTAAGGAAPSGGSNVGGVAGIPSGGVATQGGATAKGGAAGTTSETTTVNTGGAATGGAPPSTGGTSSSSAPGCTASSQCAATTPICQTGMCSACTTANECATKDSNRPYCDAGTGKCVQCSASSHCTDPATPICSSAFVCVGCDSVSVSANACAQKNAGTPICDTSGKCTQCMVDGQCSGATPICSGGSCGACSTDAQCVTKLGANPGVCMSHQDGRCATDTEAIYVENSTGCSTTLDSSSGTAVKPYCSMYIALSALSASRRLMVVRGSVGGFGYSSSAGQLTVVGQLNAALFPGNDPGTSSCVALNSNADLYIRDLVCNTNYNSTAITVNSATIHMLRVIVFNSGGGILLSNSNYEIIDSIVSDNQSGMLGAARFGGIIVDSPPATGLKVLQNITFKDNNNPTDITCTSAISATGIYAPDGKVSATCGITTCSTPGASCGSSLSWVNPG